MPVYIIGLYINSIFWKISIK